MIWYEIVVLIVPVLAFIGYLFKNAKWKRRIENSGVVLKEIRTALTDGVITKDEFLAIVKTALDAFIP